jgi:hypothetical protein
MVFSTCIEVGSKQACDPMRSLFTPRLPRALSLAIVHAAVFFSWETRTLSADAAPSSA